MNPVCINCDLELVCEPANKGDVAVLYHGPDGEPSAVWIVMVYACPCCDARMGLPFPSGLGCLRREHFHCFDEIVAAVDAGGKLQRIYPNKDVRGAAVSTT